MPDLEYSVLTDDNIDEMVELTGRTKEVLQDLLSNSKAYDHHLVLWREFNKWFAVRIDKQFIHNGTLDEVIRQILRRPH